MKRLLLIALMAGGLAFVPVQRSDAQVSIGVGGVGVGFGYPAYRYSYYGYPGYGYGYYPYRYYRPYRSYGYYNNGPGYYRYNGHRVYRHHRYHHNYRYEVIVGNKFKAAGSDEISSQLCLESNSQTGLACRLLQLPFLSS